MDPARIAATDRVGREFYQRPTAVVARDVLGKLLVHRSPSGLVALRVAETEAYVGPDDRAAHTWRGRRTARVRSMWGPPGHAYVYLIYGLHWCLNLVTGAESGGEAVLVRGGSVVAGHALVRDRRGGNVAPRDLTNGPGKVCQALAVNREHDGVDLCGPRARLFLADDGTEPHHIRATPRIGVGYAGEAAAWPLRFVVSSRPS